MAIRYILTLKYSASPHLFLDDIKKMIENDKVLYPQTRKMLLLLKRMKTAFIQLPLSLEVIISPDLNCNLERALSPSLMNFSKTIWNEEDIERYKNNKKEFLANVKKLYGSMGYNIEESEVADETVNQISNDIDKHNKELKDKQK
jgi:hypothetical protein